MVQLEPDLPRPERTRRLVKMARQIEHWQRRNAQASWFAMKRRLRDLREKGIDLERAIRCPMRLE